MSLSYEPCDSSMYVLENKIDPACTSDKFHTLYRTVYGIQEIGKTSSKEQPVCCLAKLFSV